MVHISFALIFPQSLYETRTYECYWWFCRIYEFENFLEKICSNWNDDICEFPKKKQIWLTGFFCFPLLLNLQVDSARRHGILLEAMQVLTESWELEIETENHSPTLPISPPPHTIISPPLLRNCSPQLTLPPPIPMPLAPLLRHCSWISLLRQQCPWGYPGLGSIHALALAACPWRRALALAAAFLGLGCVPMGLPWPWQHACLGFGCVPMMMCLRLGYCMPSPWLRAHRAALSTAACIPWICDGRAT